MVGLSLTVDELTSERIDSIKLNKIKRKRL